MEYVDEYRDPRLAEALLTQIRTKFYTLPCQQRPLQIMEVCGGHTHTLYKYGIGHQLEDEIEFIHGPGCPVCVLPKERIDLCIALARRPDTILCTFGDAMRVPGHYGSLTEARTEGCDIRMVYSPTDALTLAEKYPHRQVIFFALGFETTMPATAVTVLLARQKQVKNFRILCEHITIMPVLTALLNQNDVRIDGFLLPGHLSVITGTLPYHPLAGRYHKPGVVTGFEPLDMLLAVSMLVDQFAEQRCEIENQYTRAVSTSGNVCAQQLLAQVFTPREEKAWRGLGVIVNSGVRLADAYREFDAEADSTPYHTVTEEPEATCCGEVLAGRCKPTDCPLFGKTCTPENAAGALMVSSEGACAACYHYQRM